jgi:chromosome segregation ATPase
MATQSLQYSYDDAEAAVDALSKAVEAGNVAQGKLALKKAKTAVTALTAEIKQCKDKIHNAVFEKKLADLQGKVKAAQDRLAALDAPKGKSPPPAQGQDPELKDARTTLEYASKTQKDALESLARTERLMATTEDIGQETQRRLQQQTATLRHTQDSLDNLGGKIRTADRRTADLARKL